MKDAPQPLSDALESLTRDDRAELFAFLAMSGMPATSPEEKQDALADSLALKQAMLRVVHN